MSFRYWILKNSTLNNSKSQAKPRTIQNSKFTNQNSNILQQPLCHLPNRVDCRHGVEVYVVNSGCVELSALLSGPLDAQLPGVIIGLALEHFLRQFLREVAMEGLGHYRQLRQLGKWLQSGNDWHRYAHCTGTLHKVKILLVVVEQLRNGIVGSEVLLLLEILHIHLDIGCLFMLFGIARHSESELTCGVLDRSSVVEESFVEPISSVVCE